MYSKAEIDEGVAEWFGHKECRFSVSYYNSTRKRVNERWMEEEKNGKKKVEMFEKNKHDDKSQDMWVFKGLPVICCQNQKKLDIYNNQQFVVKKWGRKSVRIVEKGTEESFREIPRGKFTEYFRPGYCITTHAAQGATFDEEYSIYDWSRLDNRGRYVALSRGTQMKNVHIVGF